MKLEFSWQTLDKYSNFKFHENLSSWVWVVPCGQTSPSWVTFCNSGNLPKNGCISLKLFTRNLHRPNSDCRLQVLVFDACRLILGYGVVDIKVVLEIKMRFEQFHLKNLNKDLVNTTLKFDVCSLPLKNRVIK